ncbi:MFS general substrate transporter [Sistotremastrum niveocremeum HHB9708]|uniref:MFS general substrate transporter n=1 Tax=Sistotremastrum niveocremeum HHB9708 TaxID=1314777 RepID=A0A164SUT8_9AGAM|nr:MFS general substrate transporter [Sistotremastrum niveocremeum HHB9708]
MSSNTQYKAVDNTPAGRQEISEERKTSWGYRLRLMGALAIPVFLETLDYTVVATAQPHIASAFNRLDLQSWIGTAYLLTSAVFLPIFASLSDIFGRHWAMQISLIFFMIGSALSTGAQNMPMMLAGRGIAGIGAAGLLTCVRIMLADSRSLSENTFQVSVLMLLYTVGYSVGPVIGGLLTSVSFRWVFAINLPAAALSMVLTFVLLRGHVKGPQPSSRQRQRQLLYPATSHSLQSYGEKFLCLDFIGATLFIGGGILLLLALTWGSTVAWDSARVIVTFIIGGLLIFACIGWELLLEHYDDPERTKAIPGSRSDGSGLGVFEAEPMLPIEVFKSIDVTICQLAAFTSGMVMLVAFYFVAIFFTIVEGKSATNAGVQLIYFAPGAGGGVFLSQFLIRLTRQPKHAIILGTFITTIALGLISRAIQINQHGQLNGFMAMAGAGVGLTFGPIGIHARFSLPSNRVAVVEALNLFFRTLGGTVGLAQCAAVLNSRVSSRLASLIASSNTSIDTSTLTSGSVASIQVINSLPPDVSNAIKDAFRDGTRWAFISLIPWSGVACIAVLFLRNIQTPEEPSAPEQEKQVIEVVEMAPQRTEDGQVIPESTRTRNVTLPPPPKKRIHGPISYIIYLVRKSLWEKEVERIKRENGLTDSQA